MRKKYDVTIVGAGPAGSSCALALRKSGLNVALLDKSYFPRYKCCGDAIPTLSLRYLAEIRAEAVEDFEAFSAKHQIYSGLLYPSSGGSLQIDWQLKAYNSVRLDFDNFLLEQVKKHSSTNLHQGFALKQITRNGEGFLLKSKKGDEVLQTKFLVGCDGANSIVLRLLRENQSEETDTAVALSAIYQNVDAPQKANECYFIEKTTGYFWIIPVANGFFNAGYGELCEAGTQKQRLKQKFEDIITTHPLIKERFKTAKQASKLRGHKLPLGGKRPAISGEGFLLAGDAANLIDPLSGHGIDKAIKSGRIAAEQIEGAFQKLDFSADSLSQYDQKIYESFLPELKRSFRIMKFFHRFPKATNLMFKLMRLANAFKAKKQFHNTAA
ncbi:MAG: NAD(P)/FAD-dependent oxidoreductase [Vicingaceae bacterium]